MPLDARHQYALQSMYKELETVTDEAHRNAYRESQE